jgi:hypothetical protein
MGLYGYTFINKIAVLSMKPFIFKVFGTHAGKKIRPRNMDFSILQGLYFIFMGQVF